MVWNTPNSRTKTPTTVTASKPLVFKLKGFKAITITLPTTQEKSRAIMVFTNVFFSGFWLAVYPAKNANANTAIPKYINASGFGTFIPIASGFESAINNVALIIEKALLP